MMTHSFERRIAATVCLLVLLALHPGAGAQVIPAPSSQEEAKEAERLIVEVVEMINRGEHDEARPKADRVLEIRLRIFGPEHPSVAKALVTIGYLHFVRGDHTRARELYKRALAIQEGARPPDYEQAANTLNNLGQIDYVEGDRAGSEEFFRRALKTVDNVPQGSELPMTAIITSNLGQVLSDKGDFENAEPLFRRALAVQEKVLKPNDLALVLTLNNLALVQYQRAEYAEGINTLTRALDIIDKNNLKEDPPSALPILGNLLWLHLLEGTFDKADRLGARTLAAVEKHAGNNLLYAIIGYASLGQLYKAKGNGRQAETYYRRALDTVERVGGTGPPAQVSEVLTGLGMLYVDQGMYGEAEELLKRASDMRLHAYGEGHATYATSLAGLAAYYRAKGDFAEAESKLRQAVAIYEKSVGARHPYTAAAVNNLGLLYLERGELEEAGRLLQRALSIIEQSARPSSGLLRTILKNLSVQRVAKGDVPAAVSYAGRASELEESNLELLLATGSEEQTHTLWKPFQYTAMMDVALHLRYAPNHRPAARLALTSILRRKGRVLDTMADSVRVLRDSAEPADKDLLEKFAAARSQLAGLVAADLERGAEEPGAAAAAKFGEYQRLESEVNTRGAKSRTQSGPVTIETIQRLIPEGAALVEFVTYSTFDAKRLKFRPPSVERRYAAYVLRSTGEVAWADLGNAKPIEDDIWYFRIALRNPKSSPAEKSARVLARSLDEKLMRPVRRLLGTTRRLLISPDFALQVIPFEALLDQRGRYLTERFSITYLSSARELRRLQSISRSRQPPLVVANPDFDLGKAAAQEAEGGNLRPARSTFLPLPGTEDEAREIKKLLPDAQVLTGSDATEAALKRVRGPRVLFAGTHGFFPRNVPWGVDNPNITKIDGEEVFKPIIQNLLLDYHFQHPRSGTALVYELSKSGIALAGANGHERPEGEDGILTAFEAGGLDLRGTELVVLSACETGVGDVESGNGVQGLRRSLAVAGAESQVMSLWKVDDETTRDVMVRFFTKLRAGIGRGKALRQVRLEMLRSADYRHPYYWAGFIGSGDWRALDER